MEKEKRNIFSKIINKPESMSRRDFLRRSGKVCIGAGIVATGMAFSYPEVYGKTSEEIRSEVLSKNPMPTEVQIKIRDDFQKMSLEERYSNCDMYMTYKQVNEKLNTIFIEKNHLDIKYNFPSHIFAGIGGLLFAMGIIKFENSIRTDES